MPKISQSSIVERYKELVNVLQELASILNTELLMEHVIDAAKQLSDADSAWILFPDHTDQTLVLKPGSFIDGTEYQGLSIPLHASLEGRVFSTQQPYIINDASLYDLRLGAVINLPGIAIKSLLVLPLIVKNKCIGVLELANKRSGDFIRLDREILVSFANQVAILIDNTHRFLQTDLVTELVHELHTPLASLNTALYLLQRPDLPDSRRDQISLMVHNEFARLSELTTSFLDYARIESGRAKFKSNLFDMVQLIIESVDIIKMQLDGKEMTISLDVPTEPLMLTADKDKIKQVILNLLSNAIKYTRQGGAINIKANSSPTDIVFIVRDNGQGIPPEYLPRLFERFFRVPNTERGANGTGLGLTICKQIVEGHNGKIEVTSTVGDGTTFTIHLPKTQDV
jgi:signal transduction histidine kinase